MKKILIVEDDPHVIGLVQIHLADLPAEITVVGRGAEGFAKALRQAFDLIMLDIMLPDMTGWKCASGYAWKGLTTPIMMLYRQVGRVGQSDRARTGRRRLPDQALRGA
jgi:DNA-binding response OmpR family regulator